MASQESLTSRLTQQPQPIRAQNGRKAKSLQYNQRHGDGQQVYAPPLRGYTIAGPVANGHSGFERDHKGKKSFFIVKENAPSRQSKSSFIANR